MPQPFTAGVQNLKKGPRANENTRQEIRIEKAWGGGGRWKPLSQRGSLKPGPVCFYSVLDTHLALSKHGQQVADRPSQSSIKISKHLLRGYQVGDIASSHRYLSTKQTTRCIALAPPKLKVHQPSASLGALSRWPGPWTAPRRVTSWVDAQPQSHARGAPPSVSTHLALVLSSSSRAGLVQGVACFLSRRIHVLSRRTPFLTGSLLIQSP